MMPKPPGAPAPSTPVAVVTQAPSKIEEHTPTHANGNTVPEVLERMNDGPLTPSVPSGVMMVNTDRFHQVGPTALTFAETNEALRGILKPEHAEDPHVLRFIESYLICRDAHQAAREAGISRASGDKLLQRRDIFDCIQHLTAKATLKYGFDAHALVQKVKEVAFVDPADLQNADGSFVESLHHLAPETRRAIKSFKAKNTYREVVDPNGIKTKVIDGVLIEVQFWDKLKASELLGREKNTFKESKVVTHDVTANMRDTLLGAADRANDRMLSLAQTIDVTPTDEDPNE